jgi:hypothetical protein
MATDHDILLANTAFYQAFLDRNLAAMDQAWAAKIPLLCIHPGSAPLSDRAQVMASWREILGHDSCPTIEHQVDRIIHHSDLSLLTCYEWNRHQTDAVLLATNGFARENGVYRMILHHAGPIPRFALPAALRPDVLVH